MSNAPRNAAPVVRQTQPPQHQQPQLHILPSQELAKHGAVPIVVLDKSHINNVNSTTDQKKENTDKCDTVSYLTASMAQKTSLHPNQHPHASTLSTVVGISLHGWDIFTSTAAISPSQNNNDSDNENTSSTTTSLRKSHSNTIGNAEEMDALTETLQRASGYTKKLVPPEIVFVRAGLVLRLPIDASCDNSKKGAVEKGEQTSKKKQETQQLCLEWKTNAQAALVEWAQAHQYLTDKQPQLPKSSKDDKFTTPATKAASATTEYRGVSVLKTRDAKKWTQRTQTMPTTITSPPPVSSLSSLSSSSNSFSATTNHDKTNKANALVIGTREEFNFDWTYSTPYIGSSTAVTHTRPPSPSTSSEPLPSTGPQTNHLPSPTPCTWTTLPRSAIPLSYLTDVSQPILLYKEGTLYEDDLHDNGQVSLTFKLRVMPTCWYVLQRLFVRIDYVLVRVRDVRVFCAFHTNRCASGDGKKRKMKLCRDVTWRECPWEQLSSSGLPTDPAMWMEEHHVVAAHGTTAAPFRKKGGVEHTSRPGSGPGVSTRAAPGAGASASGASQARILQRLIQRLPTVSMPEDIPQHSCLEMPIPPPR